MTTVIESPAGATTADPLVRVVKGTLATEELAALTAVLLARAGAPSNGTASVKGKGGSAGKAQARWARPERRPGYNSPVSWHS